MWRRSTFPLNPCTIPLLSLIETPCHLPQVLITEAQRTILSDLRPHSRILSTRTPPAAIRRGFTSNPRRVMALTLARRAICPAIIAHRTANTKTTRLGTTIISDRGFWRSRTDSDRRRGSLLHNLVAVRVEHMARRSIRRTNGRIVRTGAFLRPARAGILRLIVCVRRWS